LTDQVAFQNRQLLEGAVLVVIFALLTGCAEPEPAAKPYSLPAELSINVHAQRGPQGEVYLSGSTNFPDGMKLEVLVESGPAPIDASPGRISKAIASGSVVIGSGQFRTSGLVAHVRNPFFSTKWLKVVPDSANPRFREKVLPPGAYQVRLSAGFTSGQQTRDVVKALGGDGGKRLQGSALKLTDPDVADSTKELDLVETVRFPPLLPEVKAIALAKAAVLTVPGKGRSAMDLQANVDLFMTFPEMQPAKGWSVAGKGDGTYEVVFDFINGKAGEAQALWSVNPKTGEVKYVNSVAKNFSWMPDY